MNKAKVLVLGGLRDEALTDLKNICQVDIGPVGHRPEGIDSSTPGFVWLKL